jgi:hypothetical protein
MTVEYDDGVPDTPLTRKYKPAESFTTRRDRSRGFYAGELKIPVAWMRLSEMKLMENFLEAICDCETE